MHFDSWEVIECRWEIYNFWQFPLFHGIAYAHVLFCSHYLKISWCTSLWGDDITIETEGEEGSKMRGKSREVRAQTGWRWDAWGRELMRWEAQIRSVRHIPEEADVVVTSEMAKTFIEWLIMWLTSLWWTEGGDGGCNTWTLCGRGSWQGECWEASDSYLCCFLGQSLRDRHACCWMQDETAVPIPVTIFVCGGVSSVSLSNSTRFSCLTRRVYLYLLAEKRGYVQERAPYLMSLPKRLCASICHKFKHFLLWCEVRVQLFLFYWDAQEFVGHLQKSEHLFVQSFPFLLWHSSYVK